MSTRSLSSFACWLFLLALTTPAEARDGPEAVARSAPAPLKIAVARFSRAGEEGEPLESDPSKLAELLAGRLMQRLPAGVVGPAAFDVPLVAEPEASQVREWAESAGVEAVVVGKTTPATAGVGVEVAVRAGHSGVAMANYQVALVTLEDPAPEIDALAEQILTGLGYEPPAPPPAAMEEAEDPGSRFTLIREGESISIESDELEVTQDGDERHLIFNRAVRVELSDLRLSTDRLDAYYKKGEGQPDRLVATGSVRVHQGERQARCDVATFQNSNQYVVCTGHAALRQGCDLVRGTEIRFDLEEESVRVIGAASVVIQGTRDGDCSGEVW